MSQQFKCFIQFNNNRYDIVINDNINSVSFNDIYLKIQQIFEIALNQKISFDSHSFEIYNEYYNRFLKITDFEKQENVKIVKNKSLIRVFLKNETNIDLNNRDINSNKCIETTNCVSNKDIITESESNSLNKSNNNTINSSQTLRLESELKLNLDEISYKLYVKLLEVIEHISENNCDLITDYEWRFVIYNKMISFHYNNFDINYWKISFHKLFEHYLKILEKTSDLIMAISLFPFFEYFNKLFFHPMNSHYNKVMQLRDEFMTKSKLTNDCILSQTIDKQLKNHKMRFLSEFQITLESNLNAIKEFHLIIELIANIQHKYDLNQKYIVLKEVSQLMIEKGFITYTEDLCRKSFDTWTQFYVEHFLNDRNSENYVICYIFNLFNVIHSVNLRLFYGKKTPIYKQLKQLSHKNGIQTHNQSLINNKFNNSINNNNKNNIYNKAVLSAKTSSLLGNSKSKPISFVNKDESNRLRAQRLRLRREKREKVVIPQNSNESNKTNTKKAKKSTKASTPKKSKTSSNHHKYLNMAISAITALKERNGSSRNAVHKYILGHFNVGHDPKAVNSHLKQALKRGVASNKLEHVKGVSSSGSYKLAHKPAKAHFELRSEKPENVVIPQNSKESHKSDTVKQNSNKSNQSSTSVPNNSNDSKLGNKRPIDDEVVIISENVVKKPKIVWIM